jgi:uncharacterized protein with NRDE domain
MCLVVFAWKSHPDYKLILAANRDEIHTRPTQDAHWWPDQPRVLAGRDLQAGGTWLAVGRQGRFATVTNYRETPKPRLGLRSRGEIAANFVASDHSALAYLDTIDDDSYAGVSTLAVDRDTMCYASNRGDKTTLLTPGIYGLSNASLDTPWPKLLRSRKALAALIESNTVNPTELLRLLADRTPAPNSDIDNTNMPFKQARAMTAPFIVGESANSAKGHSENMPYGTRCSTTLLLTTDNRVHFCERRFRPDGSNSGESVFDFSGD